MTEPQSDATSDTRRRGIGKRVATLPIQVGLTSPPSSSPCGACKFLRRKCVSGCIFAPHFGSDQGAARFAAVHKVFGASNVSKLLLHIPVNRRHDAIVTISYEAQARLSDPVYGCVATILTLQQQVASLQAELAMVQSQLLNSRLAVANAFQQPPQQPLQQPPQHCGVMLQPSYSNSSSASANFMNMGNGNFASSNNFDFVADTMPSSHNSNMDDQQADHINDQLGQFSGQDDEEDEEESRNMNSAVIFANDMLHRKIN